MEHDDLNQVGLDFIKPMNNEMINQMTNDFFSATVAVAVNAYVVKVPQDSGLLLATSDMFFHFSH